MPTVFAINSTFFFGVGINIFEISLQLKCPRHDANIAVVLTKRPINTAFFCFGERKSAAIPGIFSYIFLV